MSERERLEALRRGVMALRVPVSVVGGLVVAWSIMEFVFSGLNLIIAVIGWNEGSLAGWWYLFGNGAVGAVGALLDLMVGGLLVGSSGFAMTSRGAPSRLVKAAELLKLAWTTLLVRFLCGFCVLGGYVAMELFT